MNQKKPEPSPYYHKPPMRSKSFEIYYNRDYSLEQIVPNRHNYYEFYFFISGTTEYYIDNKKYHLQSGDILLISPNQYHYAQIDTSREEAYERYVLWLNPAYLDDLSSEKSNLSAIFQSSKINSSQIRLPHDAYTILLRLLEKIFINSKSKNYGADLLANASIIELLVNLAQFKLFYRNTEIESDISLNISMNKKKDNSLIYNVLNYINTHIHERISVNDICSNFYVSRSSLSSKFQQEVRMSIHQYIIKKKLFLAKQDLSEGMEIQSIIEKYSFGCYTSFYRAFKSEYGQSPQSFRNSKLSQKDF